MSTINTAETISYTNFKDKIRKVKEEKNKGRYVEIWDELKVIYSAEKWRDGNDN